MTARTTLLVLFGLGAALAASCASAEGGPASKPARACFYADQVRGFSAPDRQTVLLRANSKDIYQIDAGGCPDVDWTLRIGVDSRSGPWVCEGDVVDLVVPEPGRGPQRCLAKVTHRLTESEIKATPRKDLP